MTDYVRVLFPGYIDVTSLCNFHFTITGDLFPTLDVPRKRDLDFEIMIKAATLDLKLQPEDGFILKVHYTCNVYFTLNG